VTGRASPSTPTISSSLEVEAAPESDAARFRHWPADGTLGGVELVVALVAANVGRKRGKRHA
jgi:hypothetical protein